MLAQKRIQEGHLDWSNPEAVYRTYLSAYEDEELAVTAQTEALWNVVEEHTRPK